MFSRMEAGLRERKKQRTEATIAAAALDLFLENGFEETTVAEIAEAAEVAPRTFFAYFPTKEDVVFCKPHDGGPDAVAERLANREPGESAVDALRAFILTVIADPDFNDADEARRRKLIRETPALAAYEISHVTVEFQRILAVAVADDLGQEPDEMAPRMVAAAASAALRAMVDYYADTDAVDEIEPLLDQAAGFLEAGLASLNKR